MKRVLVSILLIFAGPFCAFADPVTVTISIPNSYRQIFYRFQDDLSKPDEVFITYDSGKNWTLVAKGRINSITQYADFNLTKIPERVSVVGRNARIGEVNAFRAIIDGQLNFIDVRNGKTGRYVLPFGMSAQNSVSSEIQFNGDVYQVHSYQEGDVNRTLLIRKSDSEYVVLNNKFSNELETPEVENGILKIKGHAREVDLLAFDVERTFVPTGDGKITDPDNKKVSAIELIDSLFDDLLSKGDKPMPLTESDQKTINSIENNLKRAQRASVVLLGGPGTGKTTLIKEAVRKLPRTWKVKVLDATALNSGAKYTGVLDQRVEAIVKASERVPIIWFADEVHSLRGIGAHSGNSNDVLEYLKKPLADGTVKMIATDTPTEYYEKINDPALQRRLTAIELKPPTEEELKVKIQAWLGFQKHPEISEDVMRHLIETAADFNASENEPSRSIGLLEAALAQAEKNAVITNELINKAAEVMYKVDPALRDVFAMREKVRSLPEKLNDIVVGQELVKAPLVTQSKIALANLHDGIGPRVSSFVAGVPGVGKTEIAKAYANAMNLPYRVIEMSQYSSGKTGSELLAEVAEQIRTNAFSVIIFDEIEKAHPKVLESLLTFLSSDKFTSYEEIAGSKRTVQVSSKNCSVIMTSNAGSKAMKSYFDKLSEEDKERPRKEFDKVFNRDWIKQVAMEAGVPEPLIDRVKAISVALPPNSAELKEILALHMKRKHKQIVSKMKMDIEFLDVDTYLEDLTKRAKQENMSNRDVIKELKEYMDERSSEIIFHEKFGEEKDFFVNLKNGKVSAGSQVNMCQKIFD